MSIGFYPKTKHYTFSELIGQITALKNAFNRVNVSTLQHGCKVIIKLKPTEDSKEYSVKMVAKKGSTTVKLYVIDPPINRIENGKIVPHLYSDGSLCLFYPKNNEWYYKDSWAETLIPWASLWLYYYEIWQETGEWLGGGVHLSVNKLVK